MKTYGCNGFTGKRLVPHLIASDGNLLTDGAWTYVWDAENRLIRQTPSNHANNKLHWTYDYMNRRVRRIGYTWNSGTGDWNTNANNDCTFIADGWNDVLIHNNLLNATNRTLTHGLDLSGLNGNNMGGTGVSPVGLHAAGGIGGLDGGQPIRDHRLWAKN